MFKLRLSANLPHVQFQFYDRANAPQYILDGEENDVSKRGKGTSFQSLCPAGKYLEPALRA